MIAVKHLIEQIRIDNDDVRQRIYSDWEILATVNKSLRLLSQHFALRDTDFCEKAVRYRFEEVAAGADLPEDYITLISVMGPRGNRLSPAGDYSLDYDNYRITGNKLFAGSDCVLAYKAMAMEAKEGSYIDLPASFFDVIVSLSDMILNKAGQDALTEFILNNANSMIPRRRYSNIKTKMPFRV